MPEGPGEDLAPDPMKKTAAPGLHAKIKVKVTTRLPYAQWGGVTHCKKIKTVLHTYPFI